MRSFKAVVTVLLAGLAAIALFSATASAAPSCEPDKVATKYPKLAGKKLKIGAGGEGRPFSFRDPKDFNHLIGLDTDIARAVFACAGVPVEFSLGSWSGLIPAAMAGQIDLMWDSLLYTPERAKKLDFVAYMNSATGAVVAKDNPKKIHSLDDLCGLIGTANLGTTQEAMLREQSAKCTAASKKPVEVITSTDGTSGQRLVQNGRADVQMGNKFSSDAMVETNPAFEVAFGIVTNARLAAGTAKGNDDLVKAIFDGLVALRANGELKKIYDLYKVDYSLTTEPEILTQ